MIRLAKQILISLLAVMLSGSSVLADGYYYSVASVAGEASPDLQYSCDDNAANTTVVDSIASNDGSLITGNTADYHYATAYEGTGSLAVTTAVRVNAPAPQAWFNDDDFTIEFAIMGVSGTGHMQVGMMVSDSASNGIALYYIDDTTLKLYLGNGLGWNSGNFTVTDFNDGQWHRFRIVVDRADTSHRVKVYQAVAAGSWTNVLDSSGDFGDITAWGASVNFGESVASGTEEDVLYDYIRIWDNAVTPS